jgi:hypothetical protein
VAGVELASFAMGEALDVDCTREQTTESKHVAEGWPERGARGGITGGVWGGGGGEWQPSS